MAKTIDFGVCDQCSERNAKTLKNCRSCNAVLPWVKPAKTAAAKIDKPKTQYAIPPVQIIGGLVFVLGAVLWCGNVIGFFPTFPGAGYITLAIGGALFRAGWQA